MASALAACTPRSTPSDFAYHRLIHPGVESGILSLAVPAVPAGVEGSQELTTSGSFVDADRRPFEGDASTERVCLPGAKAEQANQQHGTRPAIYGNSL